MTLSTKPSAKNELMSPGTPTPGPNPKGRAEEEAKAAAKASPEETRKTKAKVVANTKAPKALGTQKTKTGLTTNGRMKIGPPTPKRRPKVAKEEKASKVKTRVHGNAPSWTHSWRPLSSKQ